MKLSPIVLIAFTFLGCQERQKTDNAASNQEYYQLKVYSFDSEGQQEMTDQYLAEIFIPASKAKGFGPVGVFKSRKTKEDTIRRTYVLIPLESLADLETLESLKTDSIVSTYLMADYDNPPYNRIESILLKAFEDWPKLQTPKLSGSRADRIYELRSYESPTETYFRNKVGMFNEGGEVKLFEKLRFNAVFYGEVLSGAKMPNLMYMTTFENIQERDLHWKAFGESPEWKALVADPKYAHNVSKADILLLYPTEYSDY